MNTRGILAVHLADPVLGVAHLRAAVQALLRRHERALQHQHDPIQ